MGAMRIEEDFYHQWYSGSDDFDQVDLIPSHLFRDWSERNKKKGGQIKEAGMMS